MSDNDFEREKVCYEQNFEQARSLNGQMNQVPVLAMTLTGGLWFAAGVTENLYPEIRFDLLVRPAEHREKLSPHPADFRFPRTGDAVLKNVVGGCET